MSLPGRADLAGLWRRDWLRWRGEEDRTTRVLWFQGAEAYVDLRLPADWPEFPGAGALSELSAADLTGLCRAEGFAGTIAVSAGVCTWTRAINLRGPEDVPDIGTLAFTPGGLLETGVAADYTELWTRAEAGPVWSRTLTDAEGRLLVVLWSDRCFSLARGHPGRSQAPPLAERLAAALARNDRAALAGVFDFEASHGVWQGDAARITLSTNPLRVGRVACLRRILSDPAPRIEETGFAGTPRATLWSGPAVVSG